MRRPDFLKLHLDEGVLREPSPDGSRIIVWLPGSIDGDVRYWERIANVAGADIDVAQGTCATAATLIRARQRLHGLFGRLLGKLRKPTGDPSWVLPNGEAAEQCGERQTDVVLVWPEDETASLEERQVRARWPEGKRFQKVGPGLFLVAGIEPRAPGSEVPQGSPREQAEQLLSAARQSGNRGAEATALTDLGISYQRSGDARRAVAHLEEALAIASQLGDPARENDVRDNLGLALLAAGQPQRALELLEQVLAYARNAGDRFQEKITLDHVGIVFANVREYARAIAAYERALALAREVGDRQHQADLHWYLAILHAEMGQREQAIALAEASLALFEQMGSPYVDWLTEQLGKYRRDAFAARLGASGEAGSGPFAGVPFGSWVLESGGGYPPGPGPGPQQPESGPGVLQMAISAVKSMARFIGSGAKTLAPASREKRLRTCARCEHHTGVRCKLCGCFTTVKTWMPHEKCPIGKWPV
jgi:tetratricopeptide (TPR) repeat protein